MLSLNQSFYGDNVRYFTGVVVQSDGDPLNLGRLKIRIHGIHHAKPQLGEKPYSVKDLPWASVLMGINQPGVAGHMNPYGIKKDARVFGIFLDGQHSQQPLVLGSLPHSAQVRITHEGPVDKFTGSDVETDAQRVQRTQRYKAGDLHTAETVAIITKNVGQTVAVKAKINDAITQEQAELLNKHTETGNSVSEQRKNLKRAKSVSGKGLSNVDMNKFWTNLPIGKLYDIPLIGGSNEERAWQWMNQYLILKGSKYAAEQASGWVGNFLQESGPGLPPNAGPEYNGVAGTTSRWGAENSFGIAQWNVNSGGAYRFASLLRFAGYHGSDWRSLEIQLNFVAYELENVYALKLNGNTALKKILTDTTVETSCERIMRFYEIPEVAVNYNLLQVRQLGKASVKDPSAIVSAYNKELKERQNESRQVYNKFALGS